MELKNFPKKHILFKNIPNELIKISSKLNDFFERYIKKSSEIEKFEVYQISKMYHILGHYLGQYGISRIIKSIDKIPEIQAFLYELEKDKSCVFIENQEKIATEMDFDEPAYGQEEKNNENKLNDLYSICLEIDKILDITDNLILRINSPNVEDKFFNLDNFLNTLLEVRILLKSIVGRSNINEFNKIDCNDGIFSFYEKLVITLQKDLSMKIS